MKLVIKFLGFLIFLYLSSCVSNPNNQLCELTDSEVKELQTKSYEFMAVQGLDPICEELADSPVFVKNYGCGLFGNATYDGANPRTGKYCPEYLDGGYYVIYDSEFIEPKEVVLIAW